MEKYILTKRLLALCMVMAILSIMGCETEDDHVDDTPEPDQTMMEIVNSETGGDDGLDSLAKYLNNYPDLVAQLNADGEATFFAPTNEAFISLLQLTGFSASIMDIDPEVVKGVLAYHLVPDETIASADLTAGAELNTTYIDAETATTQVISVNEGGTLLNGAVDKEVELVEPDLMASNGVVHKVEAVMIPPSIAEAITPILGTLTGTVMLSNDFTYLADFVALADSLVPDGEDSISVMLASSGSYTVFAPPNAVFENLAGSEDSAAVADYINNNYDAATARAILLTHIIADAAAPSGNFTDGATFTAMSGATLTITVEETPTASPTGFLISSPGTSGAAIIDTDIVHTNGVAHVVDDLLLPE